jgi:hypothetical protein
MAHRKVDEKIGTPDPEHEPTPPKIGSAGELGKVGERKKEKIRDPEEKQGIWRPPGKEEKGPARDD